MNIGLRRFMAVRRLIALLMLAGTGYLLSSRPAAAQALTGALIGTVKDAQGGVLAGALVRVTSPALMGGQETLATNEKGQLRFSSLPPGDYALDVERHGFAKLHEAGIRIGAGATIERNPVLQLASVTESVVVEGSGSRMEARDPGFSTRFGPEDIATIPTRRNSMFDFIKAAPGISPTAPSSGTSSSGTSNTFSAFGSATNENQFLFDGTNFTCPCNGVARAEPGIDFIQEVHVQSVGASAEFGNSQGAVVNVVTRQGGDRFLYDLSYYGQTAGLTSQPVLRPAPSSATGQSGYERVRYRDLTTNLGGPIARNRVWFFTGYQYLRDYDSQPGADPAFPRTYEQNKVFLKVTSKLTQSLHLAQSVHYEHWVNPVTPTIVTPFEATTTTSASVPAVTFGHLTHTVSPNTLWDVRVARFVYPVENPPSTGDLTTSSHFDRATGVTSQAPPSFGGPTIARTTIKATLSRYQSAFWGADHQWKFGVQVEHGGHHAETVLPGGTRYVDNNGAPFQAVSRAPTNEGGEFVGAAAFASDAITIGDRLTVNAGVRVDRNRAFSPDLRAIDAQGQETENIIKGLGTLYTWTVISPRLGVTAKLSGDGRTMLRGSYGRFNQGVLTGEIGPFHPGVTPTTTTAFDAATGGYTRLVSVVDPRINLQLDPNIRPPRTDEYSVGVDREIGRRLAMAVAYVHKDGADVIGWTDVGGNYGIETRPLPDGGSVPVYVLLNGTAARRFLMTNPDEYGMTYDGLVVVVEKRRSHGWQAFGSYTRSRSTGLLPSSGTNAAGPQVSTVSPPGPTTFGRDPNDLTNARGLLPNDRPHIFRAMGSVDVPRVGVQLSANLQYFSGKPWAAATQISLPQGDQRIQLEPRGSRRLSSQTLLDVRVSKRVSLGAVGRVELMIDVLNVLNDTAEEGLATENLFSPNFGQPTVFVDPRRAMFGVRMTLGR